MKKAMVVVVGTLLSLAIQGQETPPSYIVEAPLLSAAPVLDGHMEEEVWAEAALLTGFVQLEPNEGEPATERTEVRIGYDENKLYLGVRCYDSEPEKISAVLMDRDGQFANDDSVQFVLDTFLDRKNAFHFQVTPLGAKRDGLVKNEGDNLDFGWDGIWDVDTSQDGEGWTAEIAIPFRTLRFPQKAEQSWGINFRRDIIRKREFVIWKPIPRYPGLKEIYKVSQAGELRGLRNLQPGSSWELKPYVLGRWETESGNGDDTTFDLGIDVKKNITSNLVLDLTYNLDFAEVEADEQQINLTRFKLFFPEKRDFFLEGSSLFHVGERIDPLKNPERIFFFSRRIGLTEDGQQVIPVLGGAKLSGQVGRTGIGLLNLTTDDLTYLDRQGEERYEPRTNYSIVRLRQGVLEKSYLGLMWLNKEVSGGVGNRGAGVDWDFALGDELKTGGFLAQTSTPGLEGDDWAGMADVVWESERFLMKNQYTEVGENFNPEMGFFTRIGIREWRTFLLGVAPIGKWGLRNVYIVGDLTYIADRDGNLESRIRRLESDWVWNNYVVLATKFFDETQVLTFPFEVSEGVIIPPGEYSFRHFFIGIQTVPGRPVFLFSQVEGGEYYDGNFRTVLVGTRLRPSPGLYFRFTIQQTKVDLPSGEFEDILATGRMIYSLSPELSFKFFIQWLQDDNFDSQLLFQWLYRPGAAINIVYDEFRDLRDVLPASAAARDRALIAKMSFYF